MFSAKNVFESILSMDCPLVHGLSPVRPWSVHAQVWAEPRCAYLRQLFLVL